MHPIKLAGGGLIVLGLVFRAISLAYFKLKAKTLPNTPAALRRFERQRRNALVIDALIVALGFYVVLRG